jgi:hypothetical protein
LNEELLKRDEAITQQFISLLSEAGMAIDFTRWQERFKLVSADMLLIVIGESEEENVVHWNVVFEDQKDPFAHFTLYIEGEAFGGFSIDT